MSPRFDILAFGAHPDDCDIKSGGLAAKYAEAGHLVKVVSVTNGNAGHQSEGGGMLAIRRRAEAKESARRLGISYEVLNYDDGNLLPTLEAREDVIRQIRGWNADIVISPRPNDYHPDHRYTSILVQDAGGFRPKGVEVKELAPGETWEFGQGGFARLSGA